MPFASLRRRRAPSDSTSSFGPAVRWGRWVVVLLAVVALHWVAVRWVDRHKSVSNPAPTEHVPVQVELLTPKPVAQAPVPKATPAPAPQKPKPVATIRHEEPSPQVAQAQAQAQAQAIQAVQAAQAEQAAQQAAEAARAAAAQAAAAKAASEAAASQAAAAAAAAAAAPGDKFNVPPSGELRYDTLVNGVMNQVGNIHWTNDGQHFQMIVSIPLPFVGPYVYSSKGHIDRFGLAPEQYSEQRGRRAADVTIFNRETKQLVYTRTPNNQPLADGAQDRFSVVMQLASLVRGAPDTYKPGVVRQFNVADNDSSEIWPIETVGDENVQTPDGNVEARHFTRLPRRDGDRRKLDFWLSPAIGWLPVRILQTEPNGMQIEMLWRGKLQPPAPPGTPDAADVSAPDTPQAGKP
jgi:Protein of unknown function (DUF3108)